MKNPYRIFVVVNPNSANRRTSKEWPEIRTELEKVGGPLDFAFTAGPDDATLLTRQALKAGFNLIAAVGGDGTNNEVVNGFFQDNKPINPQAVFTTICQGTGGDFRRSFGWDRVVRSAAQRLSPESGQLLCDLGHLACQSAGGRRVDRYFINIASFGLSGLVDDYVNRSSKALGGKISFILGTLRAAARYRPQLVTLKIDGQSPQEELITTVAAANGRFFGGGMMIAPEADLQDGLLDIVILKRLRATQHVSMLSRIYKGSHLKENYISFLRAKRLEADSREEVLIDMDGEQPGKLPAIFTVIPRAIYIKI